MPVKFWLTIVRFWFFLSYLITTVLLSEISRPSATSDPAVTADVLKKDGKITLYPSLHEANVAGELYFYT